VGRLPRRESADLLLADPWRAEVVFVVYGDEGASALEVKNTRRVRPGDLRALRAFAEDYPEACTFLLYRGKTGW